MRVIHLVFSLLFVGLVVVSCEKDNVAVMEEALVVEPLYTVPEIPAKIAELMTVEDRALFEAGPGEAYLAKAEEKAQPSQSRYHARWRPVLLRLEYNLAFVPISVPPGGDCQNGEYVICLDPATGMPVPENIPQCFPNGFPPDAVPNFSGSTGYTYAEGYWRGDLPLFAEYWNTFCAPEYAGSGYGHYLVNGPDNKLNLTATTTPIVPTPVLGSCVDFYFYRFGEYTGGEGVFTGAFGWEVTRIVTLAENDPNCNNGLGQSTAVTFGWIHY